VTITASEPTVQADQPPAWRDGSVFGSALLLIGGRGVAAAATFIVPLVLTRVLPPAAFGTYRELLLIVLTTYSIAQLGMAESLFYFIPSDPRRGGAYAANAMLTLAAAGACVVLLLTSFDGLLAAGLGNPALPSLLALVSVSIALMLVSAPLEIALISRGRHARASIAYALSDIGRAVLVVIPALVWRRLDALFAGAVVFGVVRLGAALVACRREFGAGYRIAPSFLGRQLAYAVPLQLAGTLEIVQANFHAYVVSNRFDAATFAVYSIGCLQIPLVDLIAGSACAVMMVRMRERVSRGEPDAIMPVWRDTTRKLALLLVPLLCVLWITAPDLFRVLFTERYDASVPVFRVWLCVVLLAAIPAHGPLRVLGDTRFLALQTFTKLMIVAGLTLPLLSVWGLSGAVLVALGAMMVGKSTLLVRLANRTECRLSHVLPWRSYAGILLVAGVAMVPAIVLRSAAESSLARLALAGSVYLIAYGATVWCSGLLDPAERCRAIELARGVLGRTPDVRPSRAA
jgi:O-antigen/teichoic acid export membrane protein